MTLRDATPSLAPASATMPPVGVAEEGLAIAAGVAIGLAQGGLGAGGALMAVPLLVYGFGRDVHSATTASLLVVLVASLVGAADHGRGGRVRWRTALAVGAATIPGAGAGTVVNRLLSGQTILLLYSFFLFAAAYAMLRGRAGPRREVRARGRGLWLRVVPAGLVAGTWSGLLGATGGFLVVPALVILLGLPIGAAVGTSLAVQGLTAGAAFWAHLSVGGFDPALAIAMSAGAMAGAVAGSRMGERFSSEGTRRAFGVLVVLVGLYTLARSVAALGG